MGSAYQDVTSFHGEVLPAATKKALQFLSGQKWLARSPWYMAGGSALALSVGHRSSVDLDFFSRRPEFSSGKLVTYFPKGKWKTSSIREGTLYGELLGAKVSFIAYPFFLPKEKYLHYGTIRVLAPRDIAVMKIVAISQRGRKRDFIDLYWYCQSREPLVDVLERLPEQYPTVAHDYHHLIKALMYFTDAEADPMPKLFFHASWPGIKAYFRREVPSAARKLLRLA